MSHEPFFTTQWTQVIAARGESESARHALGDLCASYYAPIVAFLRKEGRPEDSARELAHSFFEWLLSRDALAEIQPDRARFRSYLLGALKHFLIHERQKSRTQKRGSGFLHLPIQNETDTSPALDPPDNFTLPPDREFDRQWALHLIRQALASLEAEWLAEKKSPAFPSLRPFLDGNAPYGALARLAAESGLKENTLRSLIHRLRTRLRQHLKLHITSTVDSHNDIDPELQTLFEALNR